MLRGAQARSEAPGRAEVALPGLVAVASQVAVPAVIDGQVALVVYAEDTVIGRFSATDTLVLGLVATQLGLHLATSRETVPSGVLTTRVAPSVMA